MMDRLVCADGGNPDPDLDPRQGCRRKPRRSSSKAGITRSHLAGRVFARGGARRRRRRRERAAHRWPTGCTDMGLVQPARSARLDRYIGYYEPYATSHEALDRDEAFQEEVRNAARSLMNEVQLIRRGRREPDENLQQPRPK